MARQAWSLRLRVATAFLATTAIALVALGAFLQWRVHAALDHGLHEQLESESERLVLVSPEERAELVGQMSAEIHGQLLADDGSVIASSAAVPGRLVDPVAQGIGWSDATVDVYDDLYEDDEDLGNPEVESERVKVLIRKIDGQYLVVAINREDVDDAVDAVRRQLLISGPLALALAGAFGYLVAGVGLRPVERMRARAATISSRSAGERLPVPPAQELRRLALTLNAMLERLDDGLERERRFVADASHELRTPLALLLTEVELALSGDRSPGELREALRSVEEEVRRLITLSEDLLALASAEAGNLELAATEVDLADLADDVLRRFQATAEAAGRAVTLEVAGPAPVVADADQLGRVISNLVDNALRHGAGAVRVAVSTEGAEALIAVSDEGTGFVESRPLERFAGSNGSSGLGLAIVDEIVRAHGGRIDLGREGDRTVVRVRLPVSRY
ncbi:HAMP domain-containing protein [Nocardioides humilatus]|uniref:histidine kinase n=1 Tax=Nocardioides humilatus TaxID=2607660 RepID=A0A5B1LAZ1_9ACTN|nr:ATP-binding protein [Nocardioides humilatus]KAA1417832.1 HAMP domain-containing protein [Nocardioides humilatus]